MDSLRRLHEFVLKKSGQIVAMSSRTSNQNCRVRPVPLIVFALGALVGRIL
jgi:hypothetical protein